MLSKCGELTFYDCQMPTKLLSHLPSSSRQGEKKIKSSWLKIKALFFKKQRLYTKAKQILKEKGRFILYFLSAGIVQPFSGKQSLSTYSSPFRTQIP